MTVIYDHIPSPPSWWNSIEFPKMGSSDIPSCSWATVAFVKLALGSGKTVWDLCRDGMFVGKNTQELHEVLLSRGGLPFYRSPEASNEQYEMFLYTWEDAVVEVNRGPGSFRFSVCGTNESLVKDIFSALCAFRGPRSSAGSVYVLVSTSSGIDLMNLGIAGVPFEPLNYSGPVAEATQHVIDDLNSSAPCGRIVVLDGQPGTGKTFLVRSLIKEVPRGIFIMVPPSMISALSNPDMIRSLINVKRGGPSGPTILIAEDADSCLVPRGSDNMSQISALLNLSDGILGNLLDIRIICTTNADIDEMDEAIMRPGRLCRRIDVGKLDSVQAGTIYRRLTGTETVFAKGFYALAEVYRAAKDGGWTPPKEKESIGFRTSFLPSVEELLSGIPTIDTGDDDDEP